MTKNTASRQTQVAHSSFIEGSHTIKNTASDLLLEILIYFFHFIHYFKHLISNFLILDQIILDRTILDFLIFDHFIKFPKFLLLNRSEVEIREVGGSISPLWRVFVDSASTKAILYVVSILYLLFGATTLSLTTLCTNDIQPKVIEF